MSEQNPDKELSLDELKDVSGGGMGLDRLGTQKTTSKKKSKGSSLEDYEIERAVDDGDGNDSGFVDLCTDNYPLPKG